MDNKRMSETDHLKLWYWYCWTPLVCGMVVIEVCHLYTFIESQLNLPEIDNWFLKMYFADAPFRMIFALMTLVSVWKGLYRFPPKAPEGTPFYKSARYAWVIFHLFYLAYIFVMAQGFFPR